MEGTITVIAEFAPKSARVEDFIELMTSMVRSSRAEPGCLRYDFFEDGEGRFFMIEEYTDSSAVEAHRNTDAYIEYRTKVGEMLREQIRVTVLHPVERHRQ